MYEAHSVCRLRAYGTRSVPNTRSIRGMETAAPFCVMDCSLIRCATGRTCLNLRELLEAIRVVPDAVLEHHMMRCVLEDHFELYEFPNDLARWCWSVLGDNVLGEQLGLVDPYHLPSGSDLRSTLVNVIESRLWGLDRVPWCRPGQELHLIESRLVAYDTGEQAGTPAALLEAIGACPCGRCSSMSTRPTGARRARPTISRSGWSFPAPSRPWWRPCARSTSAFSI